MLCQKFKHMIENNKEPDKRAEFASIYDAYNSIIVKSGGLEEFQKEIIKNDPSLDGLFKDNGYPTDVFKAINKYDTREVFAYFVWLQLCLGLYSYHFQSQRTKDLLSQTSELKNSLTAIDSKLKAIETTLETLEADIKVNTAAIATLDKDLTAKMTENVAVITKNANDGTTKQKLKEQMKTSVDLIVVLSHKEVVVYGIGQRILRPVFFMLERIPSQFLHFSQESQLFKQAWLL